jgi:hypothetical protein
MSFDAKDARKITDSVIEAKEIAAEEKRREQVELALRRYEEHEIFIENKAEEIMQTILQETIDYFENRIRRAAYAGRTALVLRKDQSTSHYSRPNLCAKYPLLTLDDMGHIDFYISSGCRCKECIPCRTYGPTHSGAFREYMWRPGYKGNPFWRKVITYFKSLEYRVSFERRTERQYTTGGCGGSVITIRYYVLVFNW